MANGTATKPPSRITHAQVDDFFERSFGLTEEASRAAFPRSWADRDAHHGDYAATCEELNIGGQTLEILRECTLHLRYCACLSCCQDGGPFHATLTPSFERAGHRSEMGVAHLFGSGPTPEAAIIEVCTQFSKILESRRGR